MTRSAIFVAFTIVLMTPFVSAQDTTLHAAIRKLVEAGGAPPALSVRVAERQVRGIPELILLRASVSRDSLLLSLRCRLRTQCGEVVAVARYSTADDLRSAYDLLSVRSPNRKAVAVIRSGEHLTLTIRSNSLVLHLPVRALGSGALGQQIRVRDPITRRIYQAVVAGPRQVRISDD